MTDMASWGSIHDARKAVAELASVFLAAMLLGSVPFQAGAQAVGAAAPLLVDGSFEMIGWTPNDPKEKFRDICILAGTKVTCNMHKTLPSGQVNSTINGILRDAQIISQAHVRGSYSNADCNITMETPVSGTINLSPDGTFHVLWTSGIISYTSATGSCAANTPRTVSPGPPSTWIGTWRQLTVGTDPAVSVTPNPADEGKSSVRVEGNTIYLTDASGKESVVTLVPATKEAPPTFSAPGAGDLGDALQRFLAPQLWGANPPPLPAGQGGNYVIAAPLSGEGIGDAIAAAGESVVNWVTGNSAQRNLIMLGAGISMAFSHSTFAGAVDGSGATVGKQIIGGIMVAGVTGFVKSLASTFLTDKSGLQRTGEALAKGGGEAAGSIFGNALGGVTPAAVNVFRQGISQTALTLVSQGVNVATDAVVQKLQVSEKTAALVMKAPSYASSLLTLPGPSPEPGGISLNFDR